MQSLLLESSLKDYSSVAICFYASWAPFNKQLFKSLEKIEKEFSITVFTVDVDTFKSIVKIHNVDSVPTFIILNDYKESGRIVGTVLLPALRTFVRDKLMIYKSEVENG